MLTKKKSEVFKSMIPYGRQDITQADIDAVVSVLNSEFLTQGPAVPAFEGCVKDHSGAKHALAMSNATAALHVACLALDLGPGDYLWTTPNTFVASANCAVYCGAQVDFVDIDSRTYNLCPQKLEAKLLQAKRINKLPKVLVPVHLAGQSCDMAAIHALAQKYGFKIIEDASHAIGGRYKGSPIGSCRYSDITVFSFHPVKIITTGEGGMALTNSDSLAAKMSLLRSHGITRDPALMSRPMDGPWYYQQVTLGFNYRMTDMQAALGASQMVRLDSYVKRRHEIAQRYNDLLVGAPLILPWQHPDSYSSYHLYVVRLQIDRIASSHRQVFEFLRAKDIMINLHYIPVHTQPFYLDMGFKSGDFIEAESYYSDAISLPMHVNLTDAEQDYVVSALHEAVRS
jgi:UDP-4-amino-4,6-dideoxy-N-acetyl-beta-L-altrosamine transaminase